MHGLRYNKRTHIVRVLFYKCLQGDTKRKL